MAAYFAATARPGMTNQQMYLRSEDSHTAVRTQRAGSLTAAPPTTPDQLTVKVVVAKLCSDITDTQYLGITSILTECAQDERTHEIDGLTFASAPVWVPTVYPAPGDHSNGKSGVARTGRPELRGSVPPSLFVCRRVSAAPHVRHTILTESRHQRTAICLAGDQHDMAWFHPLQRNGGEIRTHAFNTCFRGNDGYAVATGDDFKLVFERINEWAVGCAPPVGAGINTPKRIPNWIVTAGNGLIGDVVKSDKFFACQPVITRYQQRARLVIKGRHA